MFTEANYVIKLSSKNLSLTKISFLYLTVTTFDYTLSFKSLRMKIHPRGLLFASALFASLYSAAQQNKKYYWEGGVSIGNIYVDGDVKPIRTQIGEGLYIAKPVTNWFALRFNYQRGNAKGLDSKYAENFFKNSAWSGNYAAPVRQPNGSILYGYNRNGAFVPSTGTDPVFYNHKTSLNILSASVVLTLPVPFKNPVAGVHAFYGGGAMFFNTRVDTKNNNGTYAMLFKEIATGNYNSNQVLSKLKNGMDGVCETQAESFGSNAIYTGFYGAGFSITVKNRFKLGFERTWYLVKSDLIDGQRWQEQPWGDAIMTRGWDKVKTNNIKVGVLF